MASRNAEKMRENARSSRQSASFSRSDVASYDSTGPAPFLLIRPVDDLLGAVNDLEIGRDTEQRWVRFHPHDIGELESLLTHPRVTPLAGDDRFEIG